MKSEMSNKEILIEVLEYKCNTISCFGMKGAKNEGIRCPLLSANDTCMSTMNRTREKLAMEKLEELKKLEFLTAL